MYIIKSDMTLGILGGGQLGRMSAMAAARLGISVVIFSPEKDCPASYVAKETIVAEYDNKTALQEFSSKTDIITYEFENIPLKTIDYLEELKNKSVLPEKTLLEVSQDRIKEKTFLNEHNIHTARWTSVLDLNDIKKACTLWKNSSFILKTARFGYDGKGQIKCEADNLERNQELENFLNISAGNDIIMEDFISFSKEISVIVARDNHNKTMLYDPMLNEHKNHVLHKTTVPCDISDAVKNKAYSVSKTIAKAVNLTGVLTVEFFVSDDDVLLVNEIAPRTHNSGHWTIDACAVSQFENHVRAVCSLTIGSTKRHSNAVMLNLIGNDVNNINQYLDNDFTCIHLYGKKRVKDGRKMGHITFLRPKTSSKTDTNDSKDN